ncbi:MAG: hypothetical protein DLM61_15865 [Pseudonocardiales bacterium]|nr:hypothetical protein [Pseudonocardiales bacterium]PZS27755.1 MAG: hypothetical protein DLM61_15865 [Pseudonocardiales bacterium]
MTGSPTSRDATTLGGDVEEVAAVLYLMAAIGVAGIAGLLWKALGPPRPAARSVLAPDDDPEFLRGLNRKRQQPGDEG